MGAFRMPAEDELVRILELEQIELDMYRGETRDKDRGRIYGGQVVAQALSAAYRTIEGRVCHSLHSYFIRPGDPQVPILFQVERVRDGGSFAVRRVKAIQHGKQIFNLAASFQTPEEGFEHQSDMPAAPSPDTLLNEEELWVKAGRDPAERRVWPVEMRPCDPQPHDSPKVLPPLDMCWFRARNPLGDDLVLNQCALAYGTDMTLLDCALRPHAVVWSDGRLQAASLDHALWFHKATDFSRWHLYVQDSPSASGGRGFNRGEIYTEDGVLVASAAQEALMRYR